MAKFIEPRKRKSVRVVADDALEEGMVLYLGEHSVYGWNVGKTAANNVRVIALCGKFGCTLRL